MNHDSTFQHISIISLPRIVMKCSEKTSSGAKPAPAAALGLAGRKGMNEQWGAVKEATNRVSQPSDIYIYICMIYVYICMYIYIYTHIQILQVFRPHFMSEFTSENG